MDSLIRAIHKYPNGTRLILRWQNGSEITGEIDTIYETNNWLEIDDEGYQEYYACAFHVLAINNSSNTKSGMKVGELIEVSMQDPPISVMSDGGEIIWENT